MRIMRLVKLFLFCASLSIVSGCSEDRPEEFSASVRDQIYELSLFAPGRTFVTTADQPISLNRRDSLLAMNEQNKYPLALVESPGEIAPMFAGLAIRGEANTRYEIFFKVDTHYINAYRVVSQDEIAGLSAVEAQTLQQEGSSFLSLLFQFPVINLGKSVCVENSLRECSHLRRLQPTERALATHVHMKMQPNLRTELQAEKTQAEQVFIQAKLESEIYNRAALKEKLDLSVGGSGALAANGAAGAETKYALRVSGGRLHVFELVDRKSIGEKQWAEVKAVAGGAIIDSCAQIESLQLASSAVPSNCSGILRYDLPVSCAKARLQTVNPDGSGQEMAKVNFEWDDCQNKSPIIRIAKGTAPKRVYYQGNAKLSLSPEERLPVADFADERFFYRRSIIDSPNLSGVAALSALVEVVRFEFTEKFVHIVRDHALRDGLAVNDNDREILLSYRAKYYVESFTDASGKELLVPELIEVSNPQTPGAVAKIDWGRNQLTETKTSAIGWRWNCFKNPVFPPEITEYRYDKASDQRAENISFTLSAVYEARAWYCMGGVFSRNNNLQHRVQTSFRFAERVSFHRFAEAGKKFYAMDLPASAAKKFGFGIIQSQKGVIDQFGDQAKRKHRRYRPMIHDFSENKKIKYVLGNVPEDAQAAEELKRATMEVVVDLDHGFHRAFKGTPFEREDKAGENEYIELVFEQDIPESVRFGDLDYNYIYLRNKQEVDQYTSGVYVYSYDPYSGRAVNANVVLYTGNIRTAMGFLKEYQEYQDRYIGRFPRGPYFIDLERFATNSGPAASTDGAAEGAPAGSIDGSDSPTEGFSVARIPYMSSELYSEWAPELEGFLRFNTYVPAVESEILTTEVSNQDLVDLVSLREAGMQDEAQLDSLLRRTNIDLDKNPGMKAAFRVLHAHKKHKGDLLEWRREFMPEEFPPSLRRQESRDGVPVEAANMTATERSMMEHHPYQCNHSFDLESFGPMPNFAAAASGSIEKPKPEAGFLDITKMEEEELFIHMYKKTLLHELLHASGLMHNFRASVDPKNWNFEDEKEEEVPRRYSSIMDYHPVFVEYFGPGPYDVAALRFAYTGLVEIAEGARRAMLNGVPEEKQDDYIVRIQPGRTDPRTLRLFGGRFMHATEVLSYLGFTKSGRSEDSTIHNDLNFEASDLIMIPRKQYKYCSDIDVNYYPLCNRHDIGRNAFEVARYYTERYHYLYELTSLPHDRVNFTHTNSLGRHVMRTYWNFIKLRLFLDEFFFNGFRSGNVGGTNNPYFLAAEHVRNFFHQLVRNPDAPRLLIELAYEPEYRFRKFTLGADIIAQALGEDSAEAARAELQNLLGTLEDDADKNAIRETLAEIKDQDVLVETRWLSSSLLGEYTDNRLRVIGNQYDKGFALMMLTERGINLRRHQMAGGMDKPLYFSFVEFEDFLRRGRLDGMPEGDDKEAMKKAPLPTVELVQEVLTNSISPAGRTRFFPLFELDDSYSAETSSFMRMAAMNAALFSLARRSGSRGVENLQLDFALLYGDAPVEDRISVQLGYDQYYYALKKDSFAGRLLEEAKFLQAIEDTAEDFLIAFSKYMPNRQRVMRWVGQRGEDAKAEITEEQEREMDGYEEAPSSTIEELLKKRPTQLTLFESYRIMRAGEVELNELFAIVEESSNGRKLSDLMEFYTPAKVYDAYLETMQPVMQMAFEMKGLLSGASFNPIGYRNFLTAKVRELSPQRSQIMTLAKSEPILGLLLGAAQLPPLGESFDPWALLAPRYAVLSNAREVSDLAQILGLVYRHTMGAQRYDRSGRPAKE